MAGEKSPKLLCAVCGKKQSPAGSLYNLAEETIFVCEEHKEAFDFGVKWQSRDASSKREKEESAPSAQADKVAAEQELREFNARMNAISSFDLTPEEMFERLSDKVVGQDEAKRVLSSEIRKHYLRVQNRIAENAKGADISVADAIQKENLLLIGPTGTGKTHLCRTASEIVSVPFWSTPMTSFTESGYTGDSVESILAALITRAGHPALAEKGIVYLDEIDKKASRVVHTSGGNRDISGEGVQAAILGIVDTRGTTVTIPPTPIGKQGYRYAGPFHTRDVMFILGGAFPGLVDVIGRRVGGGKRSVGFGSECGTKESLRDKVLRDYDILHQVIHEDIVEYGFLPELVGRIGMIAVLDPLTEDDLRSIMLDTDDAVVGQQLLRASLEGFELDFSDEALEAIVTKSMESGMGARRLRGITSHALHRIFFDVPSMVKAGRAIRIVVTERTIEDPADYDVSMAV